MKPIARQFKIKCVRTTHAMRSTEWAVIYAATGARIKTYPSSAHARRAADAAEARTSRVSA